MLTPRENLLKVFKHEKPGWIPLTTHMDGFNQPNREGMDPSLCEAIGTVSFGDGSELTMARAMGLDVMNHVSPPINCIRRKVKVERAETGDGWVTVYKTPRGELSEACKYREKDGIFYRTEHLVKGPEDLKAFYEIFDDEEYVLADGAVETMTKWRETVGEEGLLRAYLPATPLGMMVREYTELDTLAYLWADEYDDLKRLFAVMEEKYVNQFNLAASLGYDALYCTDDTSTTTISPAMFEDFCMGFTDRAAEAVHRHGAFYVHHSCGYVNKLLSIYRQTKMDAVDAVVPRENDVPSYSKIRELLGPEITIISGYSWPADERVAFTAETCSKVSEDIGKTFEDIAPGHNIIFSLYAYLFQNMDQYGFVAEECKKRQRMYA